MVYKLVKKGIWQMNRVVIEIVVGVLAVIIEALSQKEK